MAEPVAAAKALLTDAERRGARVVTGTVDRLGQTRPAGWAPRPQPGVDRRHRCAPAADQRLVNAQRGDGHRRGARRSAGPARHRQVRDRQVPSGGENARGSQRCLRPTD